MALQMLSSRGCVSPAGGSELDCRQGTFSIARVIWFPDVKNVPSRGGIEQFLKSRKKRCMSELHDGEKRFDKLA